MLSLYGAFTRLLRIALNVSWEDHIPNKVLYHGEALASEVVKYRRLKFAGHVVRRTDNRLSSKVIFWQPRTGKKKRGGKKSTFQSVLLKDCGLENIQEIVNCMKDRSVWNKMVPPP